MSSNDKVLRMKTKKDFFRLAACLLGCMALFAVWIAVIDPFHHYHAPWFGMPTILEDVVYQTPGNAVNFEYDSAIVGTSMTENFRVSWFDEELGWDTMKLCYAGAACNDLKAILECVYANDRQVEHIFMDPNDYQLTSPADVCYVERPEYLYTVNPMDDYLYLYNHDVFVKGIGLVQAAARGEQGNIETSYTWDDAELFGKERVLEASRLTKEKLVEEKEQALSEENTDEKAQAALKESKKEKAIKNCQENLNQIIPFIQKHPETEYIIYFPPYSMIYWEQVVLADELEEKMAVYTYAIEQLLPYENVKIYYLQGEDFIENLDEYRDATHHKPEYNRYAFDCIKEDKNRLTIDNYQTEIQKVYEKTKDYDYESLWN